MVANLFFSEPRTASESTWAASAGMPNPADLAFMNFNGTAARFILLDVGFYEVVPVPEPSTWICAALAAAAIGFTQTKRLRALLGRR